MKTITSIFKRNQQYYSKQGFTLIELLVAITIVAVVFGIVISSAQAIQRQGRDTQRKADLSAVQSALQQYYADQSYFPKTSDINNKFGTGSISSGATVYLNTLPQDPLNINDSTKTYCYIGMLNKDDAAGSCTNTPGDPTTSCHYYALYATLENGSTGSFSCGGYSSYNLEVTPTKF